MKEKETKKELKKEINLKDVNDLVKLGKKLLKVVYILVLIIGLYAITILLKELGIVKLLVNLLKISAPLFVGIIIAWIFDPAVTYFSKKGIKRIFGVLIVYAIFFAMLALFFSIIIPIFASQLQEFSRTIPSIVSWITAGIDNFFEYFSNIEGVNHVALKADVLQSIEDFGTELPKTLPTLTFKFLRALVDGLGFFAISLIIGFYLLISYEKATDAILVMIPKEKRSDFDELTHELNVSLRGFIKGTLLLSLFLSTFSLIAFSIFGLKGALVFALLYGLANIIPYLGPWIGGVVVGIVGFSQGITTGLLVVIAAIIIQSIETAVLHPILLGRATKMHPVLIILGLLVFGHYFGIAGLILATPITAFLKVVVTFIFKKYHVLGMTH